MKKFSIFIMLLLLFSSALVAQVGINTDGSNPDPSAGLDVKFNNKGFLPPRISFAEMINIQDPANGLLVYCTDCPDGGSLAMFVEGTWYYFQKSCLPPKYPLEGTHEQFPVKIVWNWEAAPYALGYKWNSIEDYSSAIDMGTETTFTETGLDCATTYTRYIWAYNSCGSSPVSVLSESTTGILVSPPMEGEHIPFLDKIYWKWLPVPNAMGYKWNT